MSLRRPEPRKLLGIVAMLTLVAAGCGNQPDAGTTTGGGDGADAAVTADLEIRVTAGSSRPATSDTVTCPPESGEDEAACEALADSPMMLTETQKGVICTQQYGGPDRAVVTGMLNDAPVDTEFSLRNGCEISRWERAIPVIGEPPTQSRPEAPGGEVVQ